MAKYKIGILDDKPDDLMSIKRTIYSKLRDEVSYVEYDVSKEEKDLFNDVLDDIAKFNISILLIDSKLITNSSTLNGGAMFEKIKNLSSYFPIVLITNYVGEAIEQSSVDPDKIYDKELFFSGGTYTEEKISNIERNIVNYVKLRNAAQARVKESISSYAKNEKDEKNLNIVKQIFDSEEEYNKFTPYNISYIEKIISSEKIEEIIKLLDKIDDKLE